MTFDTKIQERKKGGGVKGKKGKKTVIKVKGREGRLSEKKCIEGRKGGDAKKTSVEFQA